MKFKHFAAALAIIFLAFVSVSAENAYDGYIVRFKDSESAKLAAEYVDSLVSLYSDESDLDITAVAEKYNIYRTDSKELVEYFESEELLEYSEPDLIITLYDSEHDYDYNADDRFLSQWSHQTTNIQTAWDYGVYGNDVVIAVIDSGVDLTHPDLAGKILEGYNYVDDNTDVTDILGHGTGVAGVICSGANGFGTVGAAHRAKIIPLKVTDEKSFKSSMLATAVIDIIDKYDVDVINMSFGYMDTTSNPVQHRTLSSAVQLAISEGIIVVAAAGNNGTDELSYPASFDGVISVANLAKTSDGTYFPEQRSQHNEKVTVIAPGNNVLTTAVGGTYSYVNGTSFSSPYVAAVAALAKSVDKDITPQEFRQLIIDTSDKSPLGGAEHSNYFGYGILDAGALIDTLIRQKNEYAYISPVDRRDDGKMVVKFSNLTDAPVSFSLIAQTSSSGRALDFGVFSKNLAAGDKADADISVLDGAQFSSVKFFLLNTFTLRPMCEMLESLPAA